MLDLVQKLMGVQIPWLDAEEVDSDPEEVKKRENDDPKGLLGDRQFQTSKRVERLEETEAIKTKSIEKYRAKDIEIQRASVLYTHSIKAEEADIPREAKGKKVQRDKAFEEITPEMVKKVRTRANKKADRRIKRMTTHRFMSQVLLKALKDEKGLWESQRDEPVPMDDHAHGSSNKRKGWAMVADGLKRLRSSGAR
ncbi:hypothetical protein BT69DRAFT_1334771 [Atractiella rhizophila]|nr:hypothetical protein BT69DRAFT_1334771 [Atractiella rhizophila]